MNASRGDQNGERGAGDRPTTVVPVRLLVVTLLLAAIALFALLITLLRHR